MGIIPVRGDGPAIDTPDDDVPAVAVEQLTVRYGDIVALSEATFTVPRATIMAIIGPNGSGKSTLLSAISGLVAPASGRVMVHGERVQGARKDVAHVLQSTIANEAVPLTVLETVRMGRYGQLGAIRPLRKRDHVAVDEALERMQISSLRTRQLQELSGGQRQRVYVAQGLAQHADVLLLDEPVTGLDVVTQERITDVIREERAAGRTVLFTTHDIGTARLADKTALVATSLIAAGPPGEVLTPRHLADAYGGHLHVLDDGTLVLDEPDRHGPDDVPSAPPS